MCFFLPFWHLVENKIRVNSRRPFWPELIYIFPIFDFPMTVPVWVRQLHRFSGIRPRYSIILFCPVGCRKHHHLPNDVYGTMPATTQNSRFEKRKKKNKKNTKTIADICLRGALCLSRWFVFYVQKKLIKSTYTHRLHHVHTSNTAHQMTSKINIIMEIVIDFGASWIDVCMCQNMSHSQPHMHAHRHQRTLPFFNPLNDNRRKNGLLGFGTSIWSLRSASSSIVFTVPFSFWCDCRLRANSVSKCSEKHSTKRFIKSECVADTCTLPGKLVLMYCTQDLAKSDAAARAWRSQLLK